MRNTELLVPASSLEVLKTAVIYGADAVYIGAPLFSARAFADNLSVEEIKELTEYGIEYMPGDILLMPEGITNELLTKNAQEAVKVCIERGWTLCDRLHIRIWGDKRGV